MSEVVLKAGMLEQFSDGSLTKMAHTHISVSLLSDPNYFRQNQKINKLSTSYFKLNHSITVINSLSINFGIILQRTTLQNSIASKPPSRYRGSRAGRQCSFSANVIAINQLPPPLRQPNACTVTVGSECEC